VRTWTLTTLREKLVKIGAKVVRHAKAVTETGPNRVLLFDMHAWAVAWNPRESLPS
jgi:hypothetical protein